MRFPEFEGEWEVKKLGEVMDFKVTNSFSRENLNYEYGTVKNIHYGDIHTKFQTLFDINYESVPFINEEIDISRISEENYCKNGDVIFADASEDLNDVGKSIEIININEERLLSGLHTLLARPKKDIFHLGFSGYLFKSNSVRTQIQKESQGSKVLSISVGRISKIELSFPSVEEQKKISSFLALLDERIQTQSKIINDLKTLKIATAKKIFSGELRFKDDNGNDFSEWEDKKLGDISIKKSSNISANTLEENQGNFKIYGANGLLKEIDFYREEKPYIAIVKDGAGVGRLLLCEGKSSVLGTLDIIKNKEQTDLLFLYYLLETIDFTKFTTGSTIPHIYFKDYSKEIIGLPSFPEQTKIANFLSSIDSKIDIENQLLQKLEAQKKYLLQNMFV
ncbi:restriction endonuclease subunit S [Chryseobacterium fistulae]|uniref:Type I restriction modification DNA specificity domain-containing protein n=1 Tax=Chryseobacterium fistulae TaxID=2675058 RepID=A0A6N4XX47_9FLAO|nr:restriction endonuclease subunit S [Chryseobacterium fistulae]CAA7392142.1 hypothetical protein CHRY9393_03049 [Chryseobacterium fistulae]